MSRSKWFVILVSGLVIFGTACGALQAAKPFAASDPQSVAGNTIAPVASPTRINSVISDPESMADNTVTPVTSATPANTPIPTPARPVGSINLIEYNEKVTNNEIGPIPGAAEAANQTIQLVFESRAGELILNYVNLSPNMRTMRETELLNNLAEQTVLHGGTGRSDGNYIFQISVLHEINGENVMFTPRLDAEGRPTGVIDEIHESTLQVLGLNMSDIVFDPNGLPILDGQNNVVGWIADFVIPGIEPGRPAGILSRQTPVDAESAINLIPGNYTPEQTRFFPREVPDGQGEILWFMDSGTIGRVHGYDQKPDLTWQYGVDWQLILSGEALIAEVEANVTVECVYVNKEVGKIWGTNTPVFVMTNEELRKIEADPNLCFVEDQGVPSTVELNPENPAYRTLLALATITELVVAEDNDKWGEEAAKLRKYAGMSAEEIIAQYVEDGYTAVLPTFTRDEIGRFVLSSIEAPNMRHITLEQTHASAALAEGRYENPEIIDGVLYGIASGSGFQISEDGVNWVMETWQTSVDRENAKWMHEPIGDFAMRLVLMARGPTGGPDLSRSSRSLGTVRMGEIYSIFKRIGVLQVSGGHNFP